MVRILHMDGASFNAPRCGAGRGSFLKGRIRLIDFNCKACKACQSGFQATACDSILVTFLFRCFPVCMRLKGIQRIRSFGQPLPAEIPLIPCKLSVSPSFSYNITNNKSRKDPARIGWEPARTPTPFSQALTLSPPDSQYYYYYYCQITRLNVDQPCACTCTVLATLSGFWKAKHR